MPRKLTTSTADGILGSPVRNLVGALMFVSAVFATTTVGYIRAGWTVGDAVYMVTLTVFSVGYGEMHPIDTEYLRDLTSATIVFGCTGMIVLTGALVQALTAIQLRRMLGFDRMQAQIDSLVIIARGEAPTTERKWAAWCPPRRRLKTTC